jgi:glycosyltransferase involved in cell wall biosynthesis
MSLPAPRKRSVPLTVLLVGDPLAPVGPDAPGRAQQILARLDEALAAAGHRALIVAPQGSVCRGALLATPLPRGGGDEAAQRRARSWTAAAITVALRDHPVDLVHLHGADFHRYLPPPGPPVLVTLHRPAACYPPAVFRLDRPATALHGVSAAQAATFPEDAFMLPPIADGVVIPLGRLRARKRGFVMALGRVSPEKGFHCALDAAGRAGVPILLAGSAPPDEARRRYFREAIAPRLGGRDRFLGPVDGARKRRLLGAARCLLVPGLEAEPSSLAAMEALAAGTPVVAFRRGALAEIVEPGVTGFLVDDVEGMADAIDAAESIDPLACRRAAEARFSAARMTAAYLDTYARLVRAARMAASLERRGRAAGG